ncbi:hypothetical protein N8J89_20970 [Crossiella sp. CA-258035]|uniref:hypothetical protein n=1 Tax=Crossiella sp. CA-258035 TaxID=2981138 RepID=UPI0024BC0B1B|nr:hypothetical protein [Crossiella sp. CA-258035]WHT15621.1 hypothetical protein N8J89_20970 [Crossiella sp. CA-258035]
MAITTAVVAASQGNTDTSSENALSSGFPNATVPATTAAVTSGGCTATANRPRASTARAAATQPSAIPAGNNDPPSQPPSAVAVRASRTAAHQGRREEVGGRR